jgi:hypothetical protein
MAFNKKYIDNCLHTTYGFTVQRDATGLAFYAFCGEGAETHLSGPCGDAEAARQTGIVNLIEKIERGEVKQCQRDRRRKGR